MNGASHHNGGRVGVPQGPDSQAEVPLEELAAFHEDIMDKDVDVVRDTILDFQEDGAAAIRELVEREVTLEPLEDDHPLHGLPQSALHRATLAGSVPILSILLHVQVDTFTPDVNCRMSSNGYTPLHVAGAAGITPLASFLASNGAHVNGTARGKHTPLHVLARHAPPPAAADTARILVVKGAAVEARDEKGRSPLHIAAQRGHCGLVQFLLKRCGEESVGWRDSDGQTPLHKAQAHGAVHTTEAILASAAAASSLSDQDVVSAPDHRGNTPLHLALQAFHDGTEEKDQLDTFSPFNCIELLLEANCAISTQNEDGNTPLHLCASCANLRATKLLVKFGADIHDTNYKRQTPLFLVKRPEVLHYFLELGADVHQTSQNGDTALHVYSGANDVAVELLTGLVNKGIDVNAQNNAGDTALHCACRSGSAEKVTMLISSGAQVDIPNGEGKHAAQVALEHKHLNVVTFLLGNQSNVNHQYVMGRTLLHVATEQENLPLVMHLLELGADVNIADRAHNNAASIAARAKNHHILKHLLTKGAELMTFTEQPLHYFSAEGCTDVVRILHQQGHDMNAVGAQNCSAVHAALLGGHWDTASYLLRHKASANSCTDTGDTPLHTAVAKCRDVNLIAMLIENHAPVNAKNANGQSPLHLALLYNTLEVSMHLMDMGADVNSLDNHGNSPILAALLRAVHPSMINTPERTERTEIVNFILEPNSGVNVQHQNQDGKAAIHLAAELGHAKILQQTIILRADVNVQDRALYTPLMYSSEAKSKQCVEILLTAGADKNGQDAHRETALFKAITSGANDVIEVLLHHEADANLQTSNGTTCLHQSLLRRNYEAMELLLEVEAKVNLVDESNRSALHIASEVAPHDIVRILLDHGAQLQLTDKDSKTALHSSVLNKDKSVASLLLRRGIDVELKDTSGNTALHVAAQQCSYDHVTPSGQKWSKQRPYDDY